MHGNASAIATVRIIQSILKYLHCIAVNGWGSAGAGVGILIMPALYKVGFCLIMQQLLRTNEIHFVLSYLPMEIFVMNANFCEMRLTTSQPLSNMFVGHFSSHT